MSAVWAASVIALWVVVLLMAFLLAGALRLIAVLQLRVGDDPGALITDVGLERGSEAPDFEAVDAETERTVRLSELAQQPRLVTFLSPSCLACRELVPHLNEVARTRQGEFEFVTICKGDLASCRSFKRQLNLSQPVLVDTTGEIEAAYEVNASPFVYVLDYQRRILIRGIANDWRHLESLLEQEGTLEGSKILGAGITATAAGDDGQALSQVTALEGRRTP